MEVLAPEKPWPRPLRHGDAVQLLAASSALTSFDSLVAGLKVLEGWGLKPQGIERAHRRWRDLAGDDKQRRSGLEMGGTVPLRIGVRGGWGAARLLEHPLEWRSGWLLGFSDVTTLLWARQASGLPGNVHGPLLTTLAGESEWSRERVRQLLFSGHPAALSPLDGQGWIRVVRKVRCWWRTSRSPLTCWCWRMWENSPTAGSDRSMSHWRLSGALQALSGLAFGSFSDVAARWRWKRCSVSARATSASPSSGDCP